MKFRRDEAMENRIVDRINYDDQLRDEFMYFGAYMCGVGQAEVLKRFVMPTVVGMIFTLAIGWIRYTRFPHYHSEE